MEEKLMVEQWVAEEFTSLDLGDVRLNRRVKQFVSQASGIGSSNPDRCRSASSLKALYRMTDNPKVDVGKLFEAHNEASIERCSSQSLVYLVQDTTEVDLTKPQSEIAGVGSIGAGKRRGFYFHPSLAVSESGIPLGQVDQFIWTRDPKSLQLTAKERAAERQRSCFEEKESARWLEILQSNEQLARSLPQTHFISIADSEADIFELFCECSTFPENFDLIIRGFRQHNIVSAIDTATGQPIDASSVDQAMKLATNRFTREISVGTRPAPETPDDKKRVRKQARTARETVLTISTATATLAGPRRPRAGRLPNATVNVVMLLEENPPADEPPIRWVLYTTLPIATEAEVTTVIDGYCQRWSIELYFMTLKSGLKIEDMKYKTLPRYLNAFAMLAVVAWRVEYLKNAARVEPNAPCSEYFTDEQWVPIMLFQTQKPVNKSEPPTIAQFIKTMAILGGYINKRSQGPPGSKTIWRGMARFETIVQAFAAFKQLTCGV
jgi:hypothetical protein